MKYASAYRIPDHDDMGCCDRSRYLAVNSVGYYEFDEAFGATHRRHGRKDYYLSYNHKGCMKVGMKGTRQVIEPGTVFLYRPFEEQYYGQADENPISNYWVHFTGYGAAELLIGAHLSEDSVISTGEDAQIAEVFEALIQEITQKKPGYELLSTSLLIRLVTLVSRRKALQAPPDMETQDIRMFDAMKYIHKNYSRKITVQELAALCSLSVSRFSEAFRQSSGVSPQQYLITFRLEKACELMRHTNLNIRQISALTGFADQLYFSKLFRKYKHMPPTDYQRMVKPSDPTNSIP